MKDARHWIDDENPAANPQVTLDESGPEDACFSAIDNGVSIFIKFDKSTYPADLRWLHATTADSWLKILRLRTPLGAIKITHKINTTLKVIDKDGNVTEAALSEPDYLWPHTIFPRTVRCKAIQDKRDQLYNGGKNPDDLPSQFRKRDAIYHTWDSDALKENLDLDEEQEIILSKHCPTVYGCYAYTPKLWDQFNDSLGVRRRILYGGIQIAADRMPQGDLIQIPLRRYTGRQNNAHFVVHFENCEPDLGRKGFQKEITDFSTHVCARLVDTLFKYRKSLRAATGSPPDLRREEEIEQWKSEMVLHESSNPLVIDNPNFFLPTKRIALTSEPTREQDVIALFHQLLAGGAIRGIRVMSTNERFTYDGLYRVIFEEPSKHHIYDEVTNPLGPKQA